VNRRQFLGVAATGSLSLAFAPAGVARRWGGIHPRVLATADLESHVVAVDPGTGRVLERFRTAPGPRSIESVDAATVVVGHTEIGVVSILVAAGGIGLRAELEGFEEPRYAAIHPRRWIAYVTDSAREEVVVLDAVEARILRRVRVPGPARHISVSPDGRTIWTVLGNAAARIAILDARDARRPRLTRTITPAFLAHDVVFAPDGRTAWVTSGDEGRVALHRGEGRPARTLAAGAPPQHVAFARAKAFVASGDDGTVRRHRLDGSLVREARVPIGSYNVAFGLDRLVTPSLGEGTVTFLDRNARVTAVRKVARAAHDACIVYAA